MLYHAEIGFPKVNLWSGCLSLSYSIHALQAANSDRYGHMALPSTLDIAAAQIIEIEVESSKVVKTLYRISYSDRLDICLAVLANGFVKTVWFNEKTDKHFTLDVSKYARPSNLTPRKIRFR